jgi:endonuclease VIII
MPEGDTIHLAARRIRAVLEGRVPQEIITPQPRHEKDGWPRALAGRAVRTVDAHGKHLFVRFAGGITLHSHLRMTGAWGVYRGGQRWRRSPRRAWIVLRCDGWEVVEFDGPVLELLSDARVRSHPQLAALGPDVLGESFDANAFLGRLRAGDRSRPIGEALLDQETVAGIGNLWKSESCFAIGVSPWRACTDVRDEQALALVGFAREHMREALDGGHGARPRAVYRRAGRPCPRCGTPIRRRGQGESNRLTFWCPGCQS